MRKVPELRFDGFDGEWEEHNLSEFISVYRGLTYSPKDITNNISDTFVIRSSNVKNNSIIDADNVYVNPSIVNTENVKNGDIILVVRNGSRSLIGKHAAITKDMPNTVIGAFMSGVRARTPDFINALFDTTKFDKNIQKNLGATINQITNKNISEMKFFFTDIEEQEKIGNLFKKLDDLIEIQEGKVAKMEDFKKSMLQKMFPKKGELVPDFRFDGFDGEWYTKKADDMLVKNRKKNKDLAIDYVESVSNKFGFIKQTEQFEGYQLASADLSNYYVIEPHCFAYNPSRINVGSIAYKDKDGTTSVVSPLYVSFSTVSKINDYFIWYLFKTYQFEQQRQSYAEGGVRDTLSFASLSEFKFVIPTIEEQQKIGQFFKNLDSQIENEEKLLESYKMMKKSLLQKMFV